MILGWLIIISTVVTVNTKPFMKKLSFDGCKGDSWRVVDISLEAEKDKIYVVGNVGSDRKFTNKLHQIRLTLLNCDNNYKCTDHTTPVVNDIDCRHKDATELDEESCDIAKTLAEWEIETGEMYRESKRRKKKKGSGSGYSSMNAEGFPSASRYSTNPDPSYSATSYMLCSRKSSQTLHNGTAFVLAANN